MDGFEDSFADGYSRDKTVGDIIDHLKKVDQKLDKIRATQRDREGYWTGDYSAITGKTREEKRKTLHRHRK